VDGSLSPPFIERFHRFSQTVPSPLIVEPFDPAIEDYTDFRRTYPEHNMEFHDEVFF
jgi:hypothetical protein